MLQCTQIDCDISQTWLQKRTLRQNAVTLRRFAVVKKLSGINRRVAAAAVLLEDGSLSTTAEQANERT